MKMSIGLTVTSVLWTTWFQFVHSHSEPCRFNPLCTCTPSQRDVTCFGVPLAVFPTLPSEDIYQVTLVRSGIELLQTDVLGDTKVTALHLKHNGIVDVDAHAFRGTEQFLSSIDLSYNRISSIPVSALRLLSYLQWLNLHSNHLENIATGTWSKVESKGSIRSLSLGDNQLVNLRDGAFADLKNLTFLDLERNLMVNFEGRPFPQSLIKLSLRDNLLKTVPSSALSNLRALSWLQLGGNLFRHFPKHWYLQTTHLQRLDFSHNLLTSLPQRLFNNSLVTIRELYLDFNYIRSLDDNVFQGLSLQRLSLSNNRIFLVSDNAFEGLGPSLRTLDLSYNLLRTLPAALKHLTLLSHLSVRFNHLERLDYVIFYGFKKSLEVLDVSENRLVAVPRDALTVVHNLSRLSLQGNSISEIYPKDFYGWGHALMSINLANNGLVYIPRETFTHTPKLREVKLSYNRLVAADSRLFLPIKGTLEVLEIGSAFAEGAYGSINNMICPLNQVQWLQMDHNGIQNLSDMYLSEMQSLVHVDLVGNGIRTLPPNLFKNVPNAKLSNILLADNELETVQSGTFCGLPFLLNVMLLGNKLKLLASFSFSSCPHLHTVILTSNRLAEIEPGTFFNLSRLANVYLQDNQLTEFSWDIFEKVGQSGIPMYLNVSSNNISQLVPNNGTALRVRTLDLSRNNLFEVTPNFLNGVGDHLFYLFLSLNQLTNANFCLEVPNLQVLHLDHNNISKLTGSFFNGCEYLQILHIQGNGVVDISWDAFAGRRRLRVIDLSYNQLEELPENAFVGCPLERVNLSYNNFIRPQFESLYSVRTTLRYLDLSANRIKVVEDSAIEHLSNLLSLNLSGNKIDNLFDGTFRNLHNLLHLDLSYNPLWRLSSVPFLPLVSLRSLWLRNTTITNLPRLPLPKLFSLDLSENQLYNISDSAFSKLGHLRYLDISGNGFTDVPNHLWRHISDLRSLCLANNPVETLGMVSFSGLMRLRELDIRGLALRRLDSRTLHHLRFLDTFKTSSYAGVRAFRLHDLLFKSVSLRRVLVEVEEVTLSHQLQWTFGAKLRELTVTGANLKRILPDAFLGLHHTHELLLRITGTSVSEMPPNLLRYLADVRFLTLDLRNNRMSSMSEKVLQPTDAHEKLDYGTKHIAGGAMLSENPWVCTCDMLWVGQWLRRWMRETLRVQVLQLDAVLQVYQYARKPVCTLMETGETIALIDLKAHVLKCQIDKNGAAPFSLAFLRTTFCFVGVLFSRTITCS